MIQTRFFAVLLASGVLVPLFAGHFHTAFAAAEPTADEFTLVSGPASPNVALAIGRDGDSLHISINIEGDGIAVSLGVAGTKRLVLSEKDATVGRENGHTRIDFAIPAATIITNPNDWQKLRLAFSIAWPGGPNGKPRQIERFRCVDDHAPHAGLPANDQAWMPLDLAEHELEVADHRNRLLIAFEQPMEGKATIVIEDDQGNRVRNLIASRPFPMGKQQVEWDGLDDQGNVVKPGTYHWRSIHHPGIRPEYLFSFANDGKPPWRTGSGTDMWGPDHSVFTSVAANKEFTFLGGSVAESGYAIVAVDQDGIKRMQYTPAMGTGIERVFLAADEKYLYAAHDGFAWGDHVQRDKPGWKGTQKITLTRFDIRSGKVVEYGGQRFAIVATREVGPGSNSGNRPFPGLAGMALSDGQLYLSDRFSSSILQIDPETAEKLVELPLANPGALADSKGSIAISGHAIYRRGHDTPIFSVPNLEPAGLAADAAGNLYISDAASHTIHVFTSGGKPLRVLGKPGGPYAGPYDPQRLVNPRALAFSRNGLLWVTEDRWNPKRVTAWDVSTGKVVREKFGPTSYGASGAGFDPADPTRWIGQGALWKLDFKTQTAYPESILYPHANGESLTHYSFLHQDNRTFIIGFGGYTSISELKPDGSLHDLAIIASTHRYSFAHNWHPPQPFIDAFNSAYPNKKGKFADKGPGFLSVNQNGDGQPQPKEYQFSTSADDFAGAYWGHDQHDLTLRIPVVVKRKTLLVSLTPKSITPTLNYPNLNAAIAAGIPIQLTENVESSVDRFGDVIFNSDPAMKAFSPAGKLLWTYPNRWTNVHGSHNAPLPEPGVMQGSLFFLGMAPLDDKSDVFVINGNHGRFFCLTSDGMYLDEFFKDVRMGGALDAYMIGGECFGGYFGRSETDKTYYLQSGHTDYRIFRVTGLADVKRQGGTIAVSPGEAIAAERRLSKKLATTAEKKEASAVRLEKPPTIDGKDDDWPGSASVQWSKSGQFPASARIGYDDQNLYLFYTIHDDSPWINNGKDPTLLFKTGDSVDLQMGPAAPASRTGPTLGDFRLLIAPFEGKDIAVLYRHRLARKASPVTFTSPWRSEVVDSVKRLDNARIAVVRAQGGYRVEAAIPLADLNLPNLPGQTMKVDFGVIHGDPGGAVNLLRSYWSNPNTNLVNDVPGEIMLSPNLWGTLTFPKDHP